VKYVIGILLGAGAGVGVGIGMTAALDVTDRSSALRKAAVLGPAHVAGAVIAVATVALWPRKGS